MKNQLFFSAQDPNLKELYPPTSTQTDSASTTDQQTHEPIEQLSALALQAIFRKEACCQLDGLNEYDDDFTRFQDLGEVVTHEMQRALQQTAQKALETPPAHASEASEESSLDKHSTPPRDLI